MNFDIGFDNSKDCKVTINDQQEYLTKGDSLVNFKYDSMVRIIKVNDELEYITNDSKTFVISKPKDGLLSLSYIVLPNEDYFLKSKKSKDIFAMLYDIAYYIDDNKQIWKYIVKTEEIEPVSSINEVIECTNDRTFKYSLSQDYLSICSLQNCYVNLAWKLLKERSLAKCEIDDKDLVDRKNLVFIAINVIKYAIELGKVDKAEQILQRINGCTGLCKSDSTSMSNCGCGCSK